jgi:hypothetical protein
MGDSAEAVTAETAKIAAENCKAQPLVTQDQQALFQQAAAFFNSVGINQCQQTATSTPVKIGHDWQSESGFFTSSSSSKVVSGTATSETSIDCQKLTILAQAYNKAVSDVKCIIMSKADKSEYKSETINSVSIGGGAHSTVNMYCNLNVNQDQSVAINVINHIHDVVKQQISQAIAANIQTAIHAMQGPSSSSNGATITHGNQSVTAGSQYLNSIMDNLSSSSFADQVSTAIDNCITTIVNENEANFAAGSYATINMYGSMCDFDQNMHLNIIANNAVMSGFQAAFKNQNVPALIGSAPAYVPPPAAKSSSTSLYILLAVVLVLVLGAAGFYYYIHYIKKEKKTVTAFRLI